MRWRMRQSVHIVPDSVLLSAVLSLFLLSGPACSRDGEAVTETETRTEQAPGDTTDSGDGKREKSSTQGVPVEVTRAVIGEISSSILLSSTVETESRVDVYSQVAGLVDRILVEEGAHVKKGAVLTILDDREYALDEAKAEVSYHQLQNEFERIEHMHGDDLISVEEYENAGYELRQAELEWEKAKLLLDYTRIEAPISGVVSERLVNVGDRITANAKVFSLVNLDSLISVVHVPEREIDNVRLEQDVKIASDFIRDRELEGWVKRISPVVDPNSGTFKVTVGIDGDGMSLKPGMFVSVHIITATHEKAILVPRDAVVYDGGREYIFLASGDSTATRIELDKGFSNNRFVEVLSGVQKDDRVIIVGQSGIKDGARITILGGKASGEEERES
jgi:membrane fusion protein (multidrug efflux system)